MITPYPPLRDGIATYAVQQVRQLRSDGHEVDVLSPTASAAQIVHNTRGARGVLGLAKIVPAYDRVIIQYHPDFFYLPWSTPSGRAKIASLMAIAFSRAKSVEVVAHEVRYDVGPRRGAESSATRAMWRRVDRVLVHTMGERDKFAEAFGYPRERIVLMDHGEHFSPATRYSRDEARASLRIAEGEFVFLSIGFVQHHKGFDRGLVCFKGLEGLGARFDIVGSVRVDQPEYLAYADELDALVAKTPGARFHRGYVSDEMFDRWILASDCLVLPYREIFTSGVLERASLFNRRVIAANVGGLMEQAADMEMVTIVHSDQELQAAMRAAVAPPKPIGHEAWHFGTTTPLREAVQAEVERRAEAIRGPLPKPPTSDELLRGCGADAGDSAATEAAATAS